MTIEGGEARWEAEMRALREEITALRNEQMQLVRAVDQLTQTFRALAIHLGIASEPYGQPHTKEARDLPGFG